jgi:putative spermidine/putrescine transport system substrate-binding protein
MRFTLLKDTKLHGCMLTAILLITPCLASARETLRVLTWPGYADDDIVQTFEQRHDVKVEITYITSDDELWEQVSKDSGSHFDVFAVNTAELQRYINHGLVTPINLHHISNHKLQLPRFQNYDAIPSISHDHVIYAAPYTYSEMGLIYNRKLIKEPPTSMAAMWDPRYQGKVLAYNASNHNFSVAALLLGARDPFQLSDEQMKQAAKLLVDLRRNVLTFYSSPEEVVQLFKENQIALVYANYGRQQITQLKKAGADIGYIIPDEGALAWLDCWAISKGAKDQKLAEDWINYTLTKDVSDTLTRRQGLPNTVTPFPDSKSDEQIFWLEPLESYDKRKNLWDKILSGDRPESL